MGMHGDYERFSENLSAGRFILSVVLLFRYWYLLLDLALLFLYTIKKIQLFCQMQEFPCY